MHITSLLPCLWALLAAGALSPLSAVGQGAVGQGAVGGGAAGQEALGQGNVSVGNVSPGAADAGFDFGFDFKLDLGAVQQALGGALPASLCDAYAAVANYSAVWAEPRMRAALEAAHDPGERAALGGLLDACGHTVDQFAASADINARCGNLTAVAHDEAARNFSRGIVADRVVGGGTVSPGSGGGDGSAAAAAAGRAPWGYLVGVTVLVSLEIALL